MEITANYKDLNPSSTSDDLYYIHQDDKKTSKVMICYLLSDKKYKDCR